MCKPNETLTKKMNRPHSSRNEAGEHREEPMGVLLCGLGVAVPRKVGNGLVTVPRSPSSSNPGWKMSEPLSLTRTCQSVCNHPKTVGYSSHFCFIFIPF